MITDFESTQSVEVLTGDNGFEPVFVIGLRCTAASLPGSFDPFHGGEPPSGPEFEVTTIHVPVKRVNRREGDPELMAPLVLEWEQFLALVGEDIAEELCERAYDDAADTGEF